MISKNKELTTDLIETQQDLEMFANENDELKEYNDTFERTNTRMKLEIEGLKEENAELEDKI